MDKKTQNENKKEKATFRHKILSVIGTILCVIFDSTGYL